MELTNKTLEDLIRADYDPLRQQALLHAIKASVKKTVLNPYENPVANNSASITSEKKDSLINGKNSIPDPPKYIHFTDQTLITNNIKLKDAENTRKQIVRQKLDSMQSLLQSQDTKTKLKMQEKLEAQRREFRQRQSEAEKQILVEIERQSVQESQESQRKSETEHQKQLRVIENFRQNKKTLALRLAFDKIAVYQLKFKEPCENIVKNLRSVDSSLLPNCEEFNRSLKSLVESFDQLLQRIKRLDIKQDDVVLAQDLYEKMFQLEQQISAEIENVKSSAEVPQEPPPTCEPDGANQAPQQIQNAQQQAATPTGNVPVSPNVLNDSELSSFISVSRLNFYTRVMSIFRSVEDDVKILQNNPELKKFRSTCQKAVNIPVNAISAVSPEHLKDKFDKLLNLLQGATVSTPDGPFRCTDHPLGKNFCLLLLAKKFVSQGDSAVSSNFQAAFPIAMVIVSLWQKFPEFGTLFLAGVYRECPYLVPYFVPQFQNQPIEDYYKILGYRIVDGSLEKQDMYLKRQAGITRLFGAVMITAGQDRSISHPYKIENGWIWLCEILNLEPLPDICATVILEFLQTIGFELWRTFKGQFEKLLHFMQTQYLVKLNQVDEGGPKARLEVFLQRVIANKTIDKPQGLLPTQYWR